MAVVKAFRYIVDADSGHLGAASGRFTPRVQGLFIVKNVLPRFSALLLHWNMYEKPEGEDTANLPPRASDAGRRTRQPQTLVQWMEINACIEGCDVEPIAKCAHAPTWIAGTSTQVGDSRKDHFLSRSDHLRDPETFGSSY